MTQQSLILKSTKIFLSFLIHRTSPTEVFLEKGVLKISGKFTGEHPRRSSAKQLY